MVMTPEQLNMQSVESQSEYITEQEMIDFLADKTFDDQEAVDRFWKYKDQCYTEVKKIAAETTDPDVVERAQVEADIRLDKVGLNSPGFKEFCVQSLEQTRNTLLESRNPKLADLVETINTLLAE